MFVKAVVTDIHVTWFNLKRQVNGSVTAKISYTVSFLDINQAINDVDPEPG